jgi:hypothetical protein
MEARTMDEQQCRNAICSVVAGRTVFELKRRFSDVRNVQPVGEYLGVVDLENSPGCIPCAFRFSWANTSYCDNQEILLRLRLEDLKAVGKRNE